MRFLKNILLVSSLILLVNCSSKQSPTEIQVVEKKVPESLLTQLKPQQPQRMESNDDLVRYTMYLYCLVYVTYPQQINVIRVNQGYQPIPILMPNTAFKCEDE